MDGGSTVSGFIFALVKEPGLYAFYPTSKEGLCFSPVSCMFVNYFISLYLSTGWMDLATKVLLHSAQKSQISLDRYFEKKKYRILSANL